MLFSIILLSNDRQCLERNMGSPCGSQPCMSGHENIIKKDSVQSSSNNYYLQKLFT